MLDRPAIFLCIQTLRLSSLLNRRRRDNRTKRKSACGKGVVYTESVEEASDGWRSWGSNGLGPCSGERRRLRPGSAQNARSENTHTQNNPTGPRLSSGSADGVGPLGLTQASALDRRAEVATGEEAGKIGRFARDEGEDEPNARELKPWYLPAGT